MKLQPIARAPDGHCTSTAVPSCTERRVKPLLLPMTDGGSELERALAELSHCGRNAALRSVQSGRARTASYAHGRSASVACGLGQLRSLSPWQLFLPHGSSVCRHRAPCKPSSVIGTSVSL